MRIVVTGGSGKAGRWVARDLREHDHDVLNVDVVHDGSDHDHIDGAHHLPAEESPREEFR